MIQTTKRLKALFPVVLDKAIDFNVVVKHNRWFNKFMDHIEPKVIQKFENPHKKIPKNSQMSRFLQFL